MGIDIEFLPVGEESKSGDAIIVRYGDLFGPRARHTVTVIDGGFATSGDEVAERLLTDYQTSHIDLMVCTHPDNDHINGLITLMEREDITVGELWIHQPWEHNATAWLKSLSADRTKAVKDSFDAYIANAKKLYDLAVERGIGVVEPFAGTRHDLAGYSLRVVGPDEPFYKTLIGDFGAKTASAAMPSILRKVLKAALARAAETLWIEVLTDAGTTTAANNSSVILLVTDDQGRRFLFTGDAGMPALDRAADHLEALGALVPDFQVVQVPHHGSRHNVGPSVLDRLLGRKGVEGRGHAVCSAAAEGAPRHPAKMVTNAFRRRGYPVHVTRGGAKTYRDNSPIAGWAPSVAEPLYSEVETFDD
jgi:beta-lactamase superfamily II metal-dependent hydrolase